MSSISSDTIPEEEPNGKRRLEPADEGASTFAGGNHETKWKVVTKTAGLATAEVIVGRLLAEGIPARAWQEGAGQALGLTIGLLGTGHVLVPESYLATAKQILESTEDEIFNDEDEVGDDSPFIEE